VRRAIGINAMPDSDPNRSKAPICVQLFESCGIGVVQWISIYIGRGARELVRKSICTEADTMENPGLNRRAFSNDVCFARGRREHAILQTSEGKTIEEG
jgi:hypothetical protein